MLEKSVFELILSGELDSEFIYEDEEIFAINDINPVAKVHILIIPKRKIETINDTSMAVSYTHLTLPTISDV